MKHINILEHGDTVIATDEGADVFCTVDGIQWRTAYSHRGYAHCTRDIDVGHIWACEGDDIGLVRDFIDFQELRHA